jgi:hypothetical protein
MSELAVTRDRRVSSRSPASARERRSRAEALRRHRANEHARTMAAAGELAYLRAQLRLAARLNARLAATHAVEEMAQLLVEELHGTFAFYLAAVHERWDGAGYPDGSPARRSHWPRGSSPPATPRGDRHRPTVQAGGHACRARKELRRVAGSQLDAGVVGALLAELGAQ